MKYSTLPLTTLPLTTLVLLGLSLWPLTANSANPPPNQRIFPQLSLPTKAQGEQAIAALGAKLPEVAAWYGMSPDEFARELRSDATLWLDTKGRAFYVDQFPQATDPADAQLLQEAPYPLEDTFHLHSRPGANRVIYLDFDGHITTGTAWNNSYGVDPIVSPPYSRDSDSSTFSTSELQDIQNMWRQVAEDYAPFNVDITTEDPGLNAITRSSTSDQVYGTRVVMTKDNFAGCGCGGFAYLTVFDDVGDFYKPAFVFNTSLVGAGEAISHEAGHNLSLSHDGVIGGANYYTGHGSGATGWAPIMGVGYYQALVQWSKGEYLNANQTQDDIARIQTYGAPLVADDHGDSLATATTLNASASNGVLSLGGSGLIHSRQDVDLYRFHAGAGSYSIDVQPAPFAPNLDILAQLYDANGNLLANSNPVDALSANLSGTLASAGDYFVKVDGTGKGDPLDTGYTDYASLGRYSISGTAVDGGTAAVPTAAMALSYTPGPAPLSVNFDGSGSDDSDGTIMSYDWNFGDGTNASGAEVSHVYQAPGDFTVVLMVTDNDNLSDQASQVVNVQNQPPVAVGSADTLSGTAPLTVNFDGSGSHDQDSAGTISNYQWNFGDGSGASGVNASHSYSQAGSFTPTLTVTDNLGAMGMTTLPAIEVAPAPFLLQYAGSETTAAGTVSGSLANLQTDDGVLEIITERESGGRKSSRYSYLDHSWNFNVQSGNAETLVLHGWQSVSSDGDQLLLYLTSSTATNVLLTQMPSSDQGPQSIPLPANLSGQVQISVRDSDQSVGHLSLDSLYLDLLYIRTDNQSGGAVPASPTALSATSVSASQIDLSWSDNAGDEQGYSIERSLDGVNWASIFTTGVDGSGHSDTGLAANTQYWYRVRAFNQSGNSGYSNEATATTDLGSGLSLTASGYKVKGVQQVDLSWSGNSGDVDIYRNNALVATVSGSDYTDNLNLKGAGSYDYQICNAGSSDCSDIVTVIF
ncbi:PKD domain-containing protein [Shewanella sedimentimangrovi]|uniref:PKD domain-containing protein n=1 Tax=Shewanella sedimentimangrovi TaxID=2814293 RepID=A0ABX7R2E0_9GAMM|nr:PKD domain-containing protein [Shewanella sedimentimangrovi]QSX37654.1 PKD domain-containing protein [Shewanella sedimentimangrovi]